MADMTVGRDFLAAWPEVAVAVWGLLVLTLEVVFPKGGRRWVGGAAAAGALGILVALPVHWAAGATAFGGGYVGDRFAVLFKGIFLGAVVLVAMISIRYLDDVGAARGEYYALLLFAAAGMMLMASAGDFLVLYIGLEIITVTTCALSCFVKREGLCMEAGLKYLLNGALGSAFFLYGVALIYGLTATLQFREVFPRLAGSLNGANPAPIVALVLLLAGFGFKVAAVPFHMWLPDVYEGAPTPITAFLAVGPKAAGFAALLRVLLAALPGLAREWTLLLYSLAVLSMTLGNLGALWQRNVKRLLAYSSIGHVGYILMGIVAGGEWGVTAVVFYAVAYGLMTLGAFAVLLVLSRGPHQGETFDDFAGLAQRAPAAAAAMLVFLISLAGVPPSAGFVGKLYLFGAAIGQDFIWLAVIAAANTAVGVYYYFRVARSMYMEAPGSAPAAADFGLPLGAALGLAPAATLALGVFPGPLVGLAQAAAASLGR